MYHAAEDKKHLLLVFNHLLNLIVTVQTCPPVTDPCSRASPEHRTKPESRSPLNRLQEGAPLRRVRIPIALLYGVW